MTSFSTGIKWVQSTEMSHLEAEAISQGYRVYLLDTARGEGRAAFFNAVRETLPLDPPVVSDRSLDALSDSVWSGLDSGNDQDIVIIWVDSLTFSARCPEDFEQACSILADIAELLADEQATAGDPKRLCVLVSRE